MFTILPEFEKQYKKYIHLGQQYIRDQNISILALVRNVGNVLYDNISAIDTIRSDCKNLSYFIYENDSTDNTVSALKQLEVDISNFKYQSEKLQLKHFSHQLENKLELKSEERTQNLAKHRNVCLDYAKENFSDSDFIIVMDMDFQEFNLNGIFNSFGWFSEDYTDAMVGNSFEDRPIFLHSTNNNLWNYDCWAYRGSWWEDLQKYSKAYQYDPMMWFGFWQPPIGSPPIKINSAFGGIGIYKTSFLYQVSYEGYDCEHVCLHKNLYSTQSNFRLHLNPSQIMVV